MGSHRLLVGWILLLVLGFIHKAGVVNGMDTLISTYQPTYFDLSHVIESINMKFSAKVKLFEGLPVAESGIEFTCSYDYRDDEFATLQIGIKNEDITIMPLWTDYGNSLATIYEEYFTSMKSYNHDTLTLTVHIEEIKSPLIGEFICLLRNKNNNVLAAQAIEIMPAAGIKNISLYTRDEGGDEVYVDGYIHKDYNGFPFDIIAKVITQDATREPTLKIELDDSIIDIPFVHISKKTVSFKVVKYTAHHFEHTLLLESKYILESEFGHGYSMKVIANTDESLRSKSIYTTLNITGKPATVKCPDTSSYFTNYDNNEIVCTVKVNPKLEFAMFVNDNVDVLPEINALRENTYLYVMRFSGKDVKTHSVINFSIDGSDGVKKYPIKIIGEKMPTTTTTPTTTTLKKLKIVRKKIESSGDCKTVTMMLLIPLITASTFLLL